MSAIAVSPTVPGAGGLRGGFARPGDDHLVEKFAPLVRRIAFHLMGRSPAAVPLDDLTQSGMIGLLEAVRNFDHRKGASFETYAGIRIRGAMIDEARRSDWAPRSLYRNLRKITAAVREIEIERGRDADDIEVAERLELSLEAYHRLLRDVSTQRMVSFEELPGAGEMLAENLLTNLIGPLDAAEIEEFRAALVVAIDELPERESLVLSLYYDEELTLREVGTVLEVSESRACQIHGHALLRLRSRLESFAT